MRTRGGSSEQQMGKIQGQALWHGPRAKDQSAGEIDPKVASKSHSHSLSRYLWGARCAPSSISEKGINTSSAFTNIFICNPGGPRTFCALI